MSQITKESLEKNPKPEFSGCQETYERPWGEEQVLVVSEGSYSVKLLRMRAGTKGGLQYHRKKDEVGYILEGRLLIRYILNEELEEREVRAGDWVRFPVGCVHQEEAIEETVILEVSTPYLNDRVRVDAVYGLEEEGLTTTHIKDIIEMSEI